MGKNTPDGQRLRNGAKIADIRRCPNCTKIQFPGAVKCAHCDIDLVWENHKVALLKENADGKQG
jgi:uncharacterized OB-fold protein